MTQCAHNTRPFCITNYAWRTCMPYTSHKAHVTTVKLRPCLRFRRPRIFWQSPRNWPMQWQPNFDGCSAYAGFADFAADPAQYDRRNQRVTEAWTGSEIISRQELYIIKNSVSPAAPPMPFSRILWLASAALRKPGSGSVRNQSLGRVYRTLQGLS